MRKINVSTVSTPAKPAKNAANSAKPVAKPALPAVNSKQTERLALAGKCAADVSRFYSGASLTVHKSGKLNSLDLLISRATNPVQKCGPNGATQRDTSDLPLILANSTGGIFDPTKLPLDIGAFSRCASVAYIAYDTKTKTFSLTPAGIERAKLVSRKA